MRRRVHRRRDLRRKHRNASAQKNGLALQPSRFDDDDDYKEMHRLQLYRDSLLWNEFDVWVSPDMLESSLIWGSDPPQYYLKLSLEGERVVSPTSGPKWQVEWAHISLAYSMILPERHGPSMQKFDRPWAMEDLFIDLGQLLVGPRLVPIRFRAHGFHNLEVDAACRFSQLIYRIKSVMDAHGAVDLTPHGEFVPHVSLEPGSRTGYA